MQFIAALGTFNSYAHTWDKYTLKKKSFPFLNFQILTFVRLAFNFEMKGTWLLYTDEKYTKLFPYERSFKH